MNWNFALVLGERSRSANHSRYCISQEHSPHLYSTLINTQFSRTNVHWLSTLRWISSDIFSGNPDYVGYLK